MSESKLSLDTNPVQGEEEEEMKINLQYSHAHFYNAKYYEMMQPLSPNNQAISFSTEEQVLYRGTQIDVNDYSAPASSFDMWGNDDLIRGSKQLDLPELGFSQSFKQNELPEVHVLGTDERFRRELSPAPPAYQMDAQTCFTSPLSAPVLLESLLMVLEDVNSLYQNRLTSRLHHCHPCIQGMLAHNQGLLSFALSLFQHPERTNCVLVEVQRRSGDRNLFSQVYATIVSLASERGLIVGENVSSSSSSASFEPPSLGFDDFDEEALDREMLSVLTVQVLNDEQRSRSARSALTALNECPSLLDQTEALSIIERCLSSYDEQQQIAGLSLAHSTMQSSSEEYRSQVLALLLKALDGVELCDSLSVVCYMQELTRVVSDMGLSRSLQDQSAVLKERLASKARQWAEHSAIAQRLDYVVDHLTVN